MMLRNQLYMDGVVTQAVRMGAAPVRKSGFDTCLADGLLEAGSRSNLIIRKRT